MAEPRVFLKENRGRIEENYLEQAKNLPRAQSSIRCSRLKSFFSF